MKASELRKSFTDFFKKHQHEKIASSSLVPIDLSNLSRLDFLIRLDFVSFFSKMSWSIRQNKIFMTTSQICGEG